MKILLIAFLIPVLFSCSKTKDETDPNAISIIMNAEIVENKYWAIYLVSDKPVTTSGTASVEWDVVNDVGVFLYKRSATIDYTISNSRFSNTVKTSVQGAISMSAKNEKIISITTTGGVKFKY